jgi:hypothetical protein
VNAGHVAEDRRWCPRKTIFGAVMSRHFARSRGDANVRQNIFFASVSEDLNKTARLVS